jgi:glycosyltransferase involved in cell wall biosynthesis
MAAGLPVVAMNVTGSGVLSLIEDGVNGFLAEPSSEPAFARRLIELLQDNRKRKSMGAAARKFVEKYDWKTIADKVLSVYKDLTAGECPCKFSSMTRHANKAR